MKKVLTNKKNWAKIYMVNQYINKFKSIWFLCKQFYQEKKESLSDEEKAFDELYQYVKKEQGTNFNFVQFNTE